MRDANFYFAWVDFATPLTPPPAQTAPSLAIATAVNGGVTISWLSTVVGYTLESSDKVTGGTWTAVSGVTSNSVTVTPTATSRFYRLRK